MLEPGAAAPEVRLPAIGNNSFLLTEQLKQGPVLLAFFKISCPTCQLTLPFLDRFGSVQSAGTPRIFGISQDKAEATTDFTRHFGIHFPVLLDSKSENYPASNAYGITQVPSLFLVMPDGSIAWSLSGFHRAELETLGRHFGHSPFRPNERVPLLRPG